MEILKGREVNEREGIDIFEPDEDVFAFYDFGFDYLDGYGEELDGLHALVVYDEDLKEYYGSAIFYCGTDGISYDVFGRFYYVDDVYYIAKESFEEFFSELPPKLEEVIPVELGVEGDKIVVLVKKVYDDGSSEEDTYELSDIVEGNVDDENVVEYFDLRALQDLFNSYVIWSTVSSYTLATRFAAIGDEIVEVEGQKFYFVGVKYDNTGNYYYGGFCFDDYYPITEEEYQKIVEEIQEED